jgi:cytochrome c oxidase subunit IV
MKSDFADAEDPQHEGQVHVHVHPVKLYVGIFLGLIFLTVVTVATSYVDIDSFVVPGTPPGAGVFNFTLAMVIATMKATLVVTWFMHLKDDNRFNALVFVGSLLFAGIFLVYTVNDTNYRGQHDPYNGVHVRPDNGERAPGGVDRVFPGELPEPGIQAPEAPATGEPTGEAGDHAAGAAGVGGGHP